MELIYGILVTLFLGFAYLKFYELIKGERIKKVSFYLIPFIHLTYRYLTANLIEEPIRMAVSFVVIGTLIIIFEKKQSWIVFLISFLMVQIIDLLSMLLAMITVVFFGLIDSQYLAQLVALVWTFAVFITIFRLEHYKKINLSKYATHLESKLVRKIVFIIGSLVVILYTFLMNLPEMGLRTYDFWVSLSIWGLATFLILLIISLVAFIIQHMNDEKKKQQTLEEENEQLRLEKMVIEEKMAELMNTLNSVQLSFSQLESNHHAYKYSVPVLMGMQNKLMEELVNFADNTYDEKLAIINDYANQIRVLGAEVNLGFVDDYIKTEVASLNIPNDWIELTVLLEKIMINAKEKNVQLALFNYIDSWDKSVSSSLFIKLLSNIADNAIKESAKVDEVARGAVQIILQEKHRTIRFEVRDSAPEFEIQILKNLGRRKNSTNGTGDGFSEIMIALEESGASLIIEEWKSNDRAGKSISVDFDGYGMKLLNSHYRSELLFNELENDFEVMI